ncbi:hypothetical protein F4V43_06080 [Paenibacillus spiritus]|uniref:Methyltransferase n=1 Tax=Paenibacillus spiritus TaxID=2496557 RepID=A0A5J5GE87_9BACL|nr:MULTISPECIES: hypothetical protein [Paenibacillus]KAA9006509.1 hypothetical protein F4V43_06080 [Paenibacillus spiritus]
MARSWERMVQRNQKQLNARRKKEGKGASASVSAAGKADIYRGRNIIFPTLLFVLGLLYAFVGLVGTPEGVNSAWNWIGIALYMLLAALIFFRRPYLKIERSRLSTFKFNRERILAAGDIGKIVVSRGTVTIVPKSKRGKWVFARLTNRYDIEAMSKGVEAFAAQHKITLVRE